MRTGSPDLGTVMFGKVRGAVLALLLMRPDEEFLVRQVARISRVSLGPVQRELKLLAELGVLKCRRVGTGLLYSVDTSSPVHRELSGLVVKTVGIADVLRRALDPIKAQIDAAILFGSIAGGEQTSHSDVDVLIVGAVPFATVVHHLQEAQRTIGREVNAVIYPLAEFTEKLRTGHYFLTGVMNGPKVSLLGDEHELIRLAQERLAATAQPESARNNGTARRGGARPLRQHRSKARR
jgi:predicted nucleotidyltransferase